MTTNPNEMSLIENKLSMLESNASILNDDLNRVTNGNTKLNDENNQLKIILKQTETLCHDLHKLLSQSQLSMLKIEERLAHVEKTVYNGMLTWRRNEFSRKQADMTPLHSPAFYTSQINGYRVCAKLYLHGDGKGLNTHLSIYLVLLKGDFDALAAWPFRRRVTFTLMDQSENKCHITETIMPDPTSSSSFRRPQSEMNVPSGLPQFVSLETLRNKEFNYLKEDTLFIKICINDQ